jgi:hypothetical protein
MPVIEKSRQKRDWRLGLSAAGLNLFGRARCLTMARLKRVEQHNLNLLKDNIVLKQATPPTARAKSRQSDSCRGSIRLQPGSHRVAAPGVRSDAARQNRPHAMAQATGQPTGDPVTATHAVFPI